MDHKCLNSLFVICLLGNKLVSLTIIKRNIKWIILCWDTFIWSDSIRVGFSCEINWIWSWCSWWDSEWECIEISGSSFLIVVSRYILWIFSVMSYLIVRKTCWELVIWDYKDTILSSVSSWINSQRNLWDCWLSPERITVWKVTLVINFSPWISSH